MTDYKTQYDDAELVALQVVREAAREGYSDEGRSKKINDLVKPFYQKYASDGPDALAGAVLGLTVTLGRLAANTWTAVLHDRLSRYPTEDEFIAELDSFEMHKLEQHQDEEDL